MYELISSKMCPEQAATLKQKAGESRVEDTHVQMARNTTEWFFFWKQNWQEKVIKLLLAAKNHGEGKQNSS